VSSKGVVVSARTIAASWKNSSGRIIGKQAVAKIANQKINQK